MATFDDWWQERRRRSTSRSCADRLAAQFDDYVAVDDVHVNGRLTLGENIADLGGLKIAWATRSRGPEGQGRSGARSTVSRRSSGSSWMGYAPGGEASSAPSSLRLSSRRNAHSPAESTRVNGSSSNMKEFQAAFHCPDDAPMLRKAVELCEVW